jgi:hypothetical protein
MRNKSGKVIHIDDDLHARLRDHCDNRGQAMKIWVQATLLAALDGPAEPPPPPRRKTKPRPKPKRQPKAKAPLAPDPLPDLNPKPPAPAPFLRRPDVTPVKIPKKPIVTYQDGEGDDPWSRPPFWTYRTAPKTQT